MPLFTAVVGTPAAPQFCEVIFGSNVALSGGGAKEVLNVYHLRKVAGSGVASSRQVGAAFKAVVLGSLNAALSVEYVAGTLKTRFMDDPTSAQDIVANTIVGTVAGDRLPLFNAVTLRLVTDGRGRNYRGSKHWACIAESQTTLDKLTAGAQLLWEDVAQSHEAAINGVIDPTGGLWTPVVLSPTLSQLTLNPAIFTGADWKDVSANDIVGTMRRRKERAGT